MSTGMAEIIAVLCKKPKNVKIATETPARRFDTGCGPQ